MADEISYKKAKTAISGFKEKNGRAPTVDDYFFWILNKDCDFNNSETAKLWFDFLDQNNSPIKTSDIISIFKSKRESIKDFKCELTVVNKEEKNAEEILYYKYAWKNNCFLVDFYRNEDIDGRTILSVDGTREIFVTALSKGSSNPSVSIAPLTSKENAFLAFTPLSQAMLFDTVAAGVSRLHYDIALSSNRTVFENEIEVDNRKCIVLGDKNYFFYLDKEKDYSVIKKEVYYSVREDREDGFIIIGRYLAEEARLDDLEDFGNGIWLPRIVSYSKYDQDGATVFLQKIIVDSMEINSGMQEEYFSSIIPENAVIADGILGITYRNSDSPTIGSLLKETVRSKRAIAARYISVIIGLILIVLALALRWYKKRTNE